MSLSKKDQLKKKKPLKEKLCAYSGCDNLFVPNSRQHKCCHYTCSVKWAKEVKAERKRKEAALSLKEFNQNDISWLKENAQKYFNEYIRLRDKDLGCISCGNRTRQMHAGHFKPKGSNGNIRFNEDNCHKQCALCNDGSKLSGNLVEYRKNLIKKIGIERVEALDRKVVKTYSVIELRKVIEKYKWKVKGLKV